MLYVIAETPATMPMHAARHPERNDSGMQHAKAAPAAIVTCRRVTSFRNDGLAQTSYSTITFGVDDIIGPTHRTLTCENCKCHPDRSPATTRR